MAVLPAGAGAEHIGRVAIHEFMPGEGVGLQEGDAVADIEPESRLVMNGDATGDIVISGDASGRLARYGGAGLPARNNLRVKIDADIEPCRTLAEHQRASA